MQGRTCPWACPPSGVSPRDAHDVRGTHMPTGRGRPRTHLSSKRACPKDASILGTRTSSQDAHILWRTQDVHVLRTWRHISLDASIIGLHAPMGRTYPLGRHLWLRRLPSLSAEAKRKQSAVAGESGHGHGGDDAGCGLWAIVVGQCAAEQLQSSMNGAPQ